MSKKPFQINWERSLLALSILTSILTLSTGCSKQGVEGPMGVTGSQGATGATGATGSINITDASITVSASQWTYNSTYSYWYYNYYPTTSVNSQTVVICYVISGNGQQILPFTNTSLGNSYYLTFASNLFYSQPYIQFQYTNYNSNTTAPAYDNYLYVVTIPAPLMQTYKNVNWKSYKEVATLLNLKPGNFTKASINQ